MTIKGSLACRTYCNTGLPIKDWYKNGESVSHDKQRTMLVHTKVHIHLSNVSFKDSYSYGVISVKLSFPLCTVTSVTWTSAKPVWGNISPMNPTFTKFCFFNNRGSTIKYPKSKKVQKQNVNFPVNLAVNNVTFLFVHFVFPQKSWSSQNSWYNEHCSSKENIH